MRAADQATLRARVLAPGTRVGRYIIVERIAAGGMAELYLARARGIGGFDKLLALKLVLPHLADDPEFISMFLDEARLAATLDHPNVVHVLDIGQVGAEHFYAMEYVHGRDLRALARVHGERAIPLPCAVGITLGAAAGLHHAHERLGHDGRAIGLVHRDVSPSNVLVTYDGVVKVVDFGIARAEARSKATRAGVVKGKQGYMSPEQCRGDAVDRRSDVFGLGILLWELTVGRRLFTGDNDYAVMSKIVFGMVTDPRELVPGYPPRLAEIVMRALQRDPLARQASAHELALELESFAHDEHLLVNQHVLAELMQHSFGDHPYPAPGRIGEEHDIDEEAATRVSLVESGRRSPPSQRTVIAAVSVPVLAIVLAGAVWISLHWRGEAERDGLATVDDAAQQPSVAAPSPVIDAPAAPVAAAITAVDEPAVVPPSEPIDEPELLVPSETEQPAGGGGSGARSKRARARAVPATAAPVPVVAPTRRDDPPTTAARDPRRVPMPDRPNELFPPDPQGAPASE
jgi:serine/threonine protein kinase